MIKKLLPLTLALGCTASTASSRSESIEPDPFVSDPDTAALEQSVSSLLDAHSNLQPVFTHDGKRVVFLSNRTGLMTMFVADLTTPELPPRLLVEWKDSIYSALVTWDDDAVIFSSDHQGDEQPRLFRVPLQGGPVETLTPDPLNRDAPFLPEGAPNRLFFSGRSLDSPQTTIYSVDLQSPHESRVLHQDPGAGFLVDVSRDGRRGLFARFRTYQEQELVLVELASGEQRTIYPSAGSATIRTAAFSPDGRRAYVLTDEGKEQAVVLLLDLEKGTEVARYTETSPPTAIGEGIVVSRQGDTVAVAFDAGNHGEIRLLDGTSLQPRAALRLPLGRGQPSSFSHDGTKLAIHWSTPAHPSDLFSVSTADGTVTRLLTEHLDALERLPPMEVSLESITSFDGLNIPVNVYRAGEGRRPVIVYLHGGPAGASSIGWSTRARFFVSRGYAWVEPNIRGSGGFGRSFQAADDGRKRPDSFKDIDAVRSWLAAQPWADADRLVVFGDSFGGFLVLHQLVENPSVWRAGVDAFGIADFTTFMATTDGLVLENYKHELGDPVAEREFLASLSPLSRVERIRAPLFVYAGANDPRVPRSQSDQIVDALRRLGVSVEYMLGEDEGHGISRRENEIEFHVRVARFLAKALGS